jgi:flagellar export protein FliJ
LPGFSLNENPGAKRIIGEIMKKFNFRLDKLMNFKSQVLDNEKMTLANLDNEKNKAIMKLNSLQQEKDKCAGELREKQDSEEITTSAFQLYYKYDQYLSEQIKEVMTALALIGARIEKQIEVLKKIKLETKSLETVKNSKLADYRKEEIKSEEHFMDEFVSTARVMSSNNIGGLR